MPTNSSEPPLAQNVMEPRYLEPSRESRIKLVVLYVFVFAVLLSFRKWALPFWSHLSTLPRCEFCYGFGLFSSQEHFCFAPLVSRLLGSPCSP
jgi:hypothetical protein